MARTIEIVVDGADGAYQAMVKRVTDSNERMTRDVVRGAAQTAAAFNNVSGVLVKLPGVLGTIAGAFGVTFGAGAIIAFTKNVIDAAGQIDDLSKRTGFSRQTLSGLKSTIEENGGSLEGFATAINKAQKSLADIEGDGRKAAQAFAAMGLDVKKLQSSTPEKFFEQFAEALSKVENQNQKVAIATRVMGKAGAEQIPVVLELADKFKDLRERGVSDENIKQLDKFGDAMTRLKNSTIGLVQEGLAKFLALSDRVFGISGVAQAQNAITNASKQVAQLDAQIKILQESPAAKRSTALEQFGFKTGREQELLTLQEKRAAAAANLLNASRELDRLQLAERDKPPVGGPSGFPDEEKINKAVEAIEQAKTKLAQLTLASAEAARAQGDFTVDVRALAVAMIEQEKNAELLAAAHNNTLTPALRTLIEAQRTAKIAQLDATEADKARARVVATANIQLEAETDLAKITAEAWDLYRQSLEKENQATLAAIDSERQLGDILADRVGILGKTTEAEALRLQNQIKFLEAQKKFQAAQDADTAAGKAKLGIIDAQITNAQLQLQKLGSVTVDIGQHIGNTLNDIFTALITGTLKSVDVGKSALATVGRIATDIFQQAITKKLSFETTLFQNIQGLPGQANSALAAGAAALPGGQSSTGVGGFLQQIFGGGVGTTGGGGFLSGLGNLFGLLPSGLSLGGLAGAGLGGFGLAKLTGAGGLGQGLSSIGSILGNVLGAINPGTVSLLGSTFSGSTVSGIIGSLAGDVLGPALGGLVGDFILPGIGSLLGILFGQLFSHVPNPTVELQAKFSGIFYDALQDLFKPGTVTTNITRTQDIAGSIAKQVKTEVQQILETLSKQWTDILNIFPITVRETMIPGLDRANEILNTIFSRLKFTEGGSHDIAEEIKLLQGVSGPHRFFFALRETIGLGIAESLKAAGLGEAAGLVPSAFTGLPDTVKSRQDAFKAAGLLPPKGDEGKNKEAIDAFITALKDFAGITGGLAKVSPGGVGQFLTAPDLAALNEQISSVLSITEGEQFTEGVNQLKERIKPVLDFLQQSLSDTANIFGRGLIAALEAATESDAKVAFLNNLGQGAKDLIFKGITDAFIASAQFNDLLAPIQQTIRQFTQEAIATGATPDIDAFRAAILPAIENISTRAETLAPLIAELQKLGLDVKNALGLITATPTTPSPTTININIDQFTGTEEDTRALARRLDDYLSGRLAPAA
jgi:hypothetical protein